MALIEVDVSNLSEKEQNEFIEGFGSIFALSDMDEDAESPAPWCAPWTYTDSITIDDQNLTTKTYYFSLGRNYAFNVATDVLKAMEQEIETEIVEYLNEQSVENKYLKIQDSTREAIDEFEDDPNAREPKIRLNLTGYTQQFIEVLEPELKISHLSPVTPAGKNNKSSKLAFYDYDDQVVNLNQINIATASFLNKLSDLGKTMYSHYLENNVVLNQDQEKSFSR